MISPWLITATLSANATSITTTTVDDLDQCENTSGDTTGANCPDNSKRGWYSLLDVHDGVPGFRTRPQRKVTGEKKEKIIKNIKLICIFLTILIGGYLLSN